MHHVSMAAVHFSKTLTPARLMTWVCMACTVAWLILAFLIPLPGMLALIIGISWALLDGGADVNLQPRKKGLPLYTAINKDQVAIAIALLKAGAKTTSMIHARAINTVFRTNFKDRDTDRLEELRALLASAPAYETLRQRGVSC